MAEGHLSEFLEQVDYHSRRLAKLDVPPNSVLASLKEHEGALAPDLRKLFPNDYRAHLSALDHLYFCIKLTLNSAYYQVRDMEAQTFYEVFQDQLQSLNVQELMGRVLDTLMRTFRAQAGEKVGSQGLEGPGRGVGRRVQHHGRTRHGGTNRQERRVDGGG